MQYYTLEFNKLSKPVYSFGNKPSILIFFK